MKPGSITAGRILLALCVTGASIALISWGHKKQRNDFQQYHQQTDTVPRPKKAEREKKVRDLDEVLEELDKVNIEVDIKNAMKEVENSLKEFDAEKLKMQLEKAMKEVDFEKIQKEMKESMKNLDLDMAKMQKELKESMKEFDGNKIKLEIEKALKEIDFEKIEREVKESISKIDMEEMQKEFEKVKKIDMKEFEENMATMKKEMEKIGPQLQEELKNARVEIEKAKAEMKQYKEFVDGLDRDGLINKKEDYTIKHEDGELYINGKKASNETYLKYKSFLEKHKKFDIRKSEDDFDMDVD